MKKNFQQKFQEKATVFMAGRNGIATCDTLALSRRLRPDLPDHKLATLVERLPVDGVNSHDALDDALACAGAALWIAAGGAGAVALGRDGPRSRAA